MVFTQIWFNRIKETSFFGGLRGYLAHLINYPRCRHCGSSKVTAWSSRMINTYGIEILHDILPKTPYQIPRKKKRGRPPGAKSKEEVPKPRETALKSKKKAPMKPLRLRTLRTVGLIRILRRNDSHCNRRCVDRHSCMQEIEYQEYINLSS